MSQDESSVFGEAPLLARHHFINDFLEVGGRVRVPLWQSYCRATLGGVLREAERYSREKADQDNLWNSFVGVCGRGIPIDAGPTPTRPVDMSLLFRS